MKGNFCRITVISIFVVMLQLSLPVICNADMTSDLQLLKNYLNDQQWSNALSQLRMLVTTYPGNAASFIIDDENKKLWGSKLTDAILVMEQCAKSSEKNAIGLKLKVALIDCYKNQCDWTKVLPLLETLRSDYPNEKCTYHNLKAICNLSMGQDDVALSEEKQALDTFTGSSDENALIGSVLSCSSSNKILIRAAYTLIRYTPESNDYMKADIYKWAGQLCQQAGRPVEALPVLNKAMQLYDNAGATEKKSLVIKNILNCYKAAGLDVESREFLKSLHENDPACIAAYENQSLMHFYLDDKEYTDALSSCNNLLTNSSDPGYIIDALTVSAECLYSLGRGQEALDLVDRFFNNHPGMEVEKGYVNALVAYYAKKDPATADKSLREFLEEHPSSPYTNSAKELLAANLLWRSKKTDEAKAIYNELISKGVDTADIRFNLAYCCYFAKDYAGAKDAFNYVYDHFINISYQASALYMMADCCEKSGDSASAKSALQTLLKEYTAASVTANVPDKLSRLNQAEEAKINDAINE